MDRANNIPTLDIQNKTNPKELFLNCWIYREQVYYVCTFRRYMCLVFLFINRLKKQTLYNLYDQSSGTCILRQLKLHPYFWAQCTLDRGIKWSVLLLQVHLQEHFEGVGICVSDLSRGIRIYARALVLVMWVGPTYRQLLYIYLSLSKWVGRFNPSLITSINTTLTLWSSDKIQILSKSDYQDRRV